MGLFNLGEEETSVGVTWKDLGLTGTQTARDLWRQKDLGNFPERYEATIPSHGVVLLRIFPAK